EVPPLPALRRDSPNFAERLRVCEKLAGSQGAEGGKAGGGDHHLFGLGVENANDEGVVASHRAKDGHKTLPKLDSGRVYTAVPRCDAQVLYGSLTGNVTDPASAAV